MTGGSHDKDAFFFSDSESYGEVRGEGADRVEGPFRGRGYMPGQHATSHARRRSALVEPAHGQVQPFLGGSLYGACAPKELGIPRSPERAELLIRGLHGHTEAKL